jgi:hypothetical protein
LAAHGTHWWLVTSHAGASALVQLLFCVHATQVFELSSHAG